MNLLQRYNNEKTSGLKAAAASVEANEFGYERGREWDEKSSSECNVHRYNAKESKTLRAR